MVLPISNPEFRHSYKEQKMGSNNQCDFFYTFPNCSPMLNDTLLLNVSKVSKTICNIARCFKTTQCWSPGAYLKGSLYSKSNRKVHFHLLTATTAAESQALLYHMCTWINLQLLLPSESWMAYACIIATSGYQWLQFSHTTFTGIYCRS